MDRYRLERPRELTPDGNDAQMLLLAREGDKHEILYLDRLRSQGREIVEIAKDQAFVCAAEQTMQAIRSNRDVIYQAALQASNFAGYADFLIRDPDGHYEIWDTKLGRSPKPH